MKKTVIHIPYDFTKMDEIKEYINNNNMGYEMLHIKSNSLNVYGNSKQTNDFLFFIKKYDGVLPLINESIKLKHSFIVLKKLHFSPRTPFYFTPVEISSVYNLAGNVAINNSRIAIIELGGGYRPTDLTAYWTHLGLITTPVVNSISIDGATNSPGPNGDSIEVVLDIQMAGGVNYNSTIDVFFAPNSFEGYYNAFHTAIYSGVYDTISTSWGNPESLWGSANLQLFNNLFQYAAEIANITITAASGDRGASDGESGLNVDFPASSPWVLGCGGTTLNCPTRVYSNPSTSETVWNNSTGSTGGGFSIVSNLPAHQTSAVILNYPNQTKRAVPDISANADPFTGYVIYLYNSYLIVGGTSAVAPIIAAYIASFKKGYILNKLYNSYNSTELITHDIVSGNNSNGSNSNMCGSCTLPTSDLSKWSALSKYDVCTGLGTINGTILTPIINSY
jgi:kumamolisin